MKNRDRYILKRAEIDMLREIQQHLLKNNCDCCVLDAITGKPIRCPINHFYVKEQLTIEICEPCIRKWLNEEG